MILTLIPHLMHFKSRRQKILKKKRKKRRNHLEEDSFRPTRDVLGNVNWLKEHQQYE